MAARSQLAALLLPLLFLGCTRAPDASQLEGVAAAAPGVLSHATQSCDIPPGQWPSALARLKPKRMYVTPEGLYVVLSASFVEERGLFVPRLLAFAPLAGGDPAYTPLGQGVFSYYLKG